MRSAKLVALASIFVLAVASSTAHALPRIHRGPTSPRLFRSRAANPKPPRRMAHIEPERAVQMQTALIAAGYMSGTPSGEWDLQTQSAMEKLQADNGWQTKLVPDARAIIKLGLGPSASTVSDLAASAGENHDTTPTSAEPSQSVTPSNQ